MAAWKFLALVACIAFFSHAETEARHLETRAVITCETILAPKLCKNFRDIAANLKLTSTVIDDAVRDLVKKGITSVPEVITGVRAYLKNLITLKGCEDLLSKNICSTIFKVTDALKVGRDIATGFIREVLVMGIPTPLKVTKLVLDKVRTYVKDRKCEFFLAKDICERLRRVARGFKTDVALVEEFVKEAIINGYQRRDEIAKAVVDYLRARVLSVKCDDLVNPKICGILRAVATNLKLKIKAVDTAVKEAILLGITTPQSIVQFARDFLKNQVINAKCEDLILKHLCERLRSIAKKMKVNVDLVDNFVKDAIANGKATVSEITGFVTDLIKASIKCENWLGDRTCGLIRRIAKIYKVGFDTVLQKLRDIISSGKFVVSEIFKELIDFIKPDWLG